MSQSPADAMGTPEPDDHAGDSVYSEAELRSLVDYLSGEGSPDARAAVEQRLATDASFAAFAAPLMLAWRAPVPQPAWDWDTNWAVIQRKATLLHGKKSPSRWRAMQWASLVLVIVAALVTRNIFRATLRPSYHYKGGLTSATIRLPDSSTVILAPGSYLGTERGFPETTRTIYLFGDARFIVVSNPRVPFIVQAPGVSTRVLGTAFRVQVDTSPHVRVDVTQGAVSVETCDSAGHWQQLNVLTAGQAVHVPMLAIWMAQTGYSLAATGMPIREMAHIEAALRRAVVRAGAAAATR